MFVRRGEAFELDVRNILDDAGDFEKYRHDIPVICVNGREIARHGLTAEQLRAALSTPAADV